MRQDDRQYFEQRAQAEASLAQLAQHPMAVAAHKELATLYSQRAAAGGRPRLVSHVQGWAQ